VLREHAVEQLRGMLVRQGYPRLRMLLLVALAGGCGFLASYLMLHRGVSSIALRYPLALCAAYAAFLLLLWAWLRTRARDYADLPDPGGGGQVGCAHDAPSASSSSFDALDGLSAADEAALPLLAIALVLIVALASLWVVYVAPTLFAELLLDGALAAGLYRRLRRSETRHWLETALRSTLLPFLLTVLALAAFGLGVHHLRPGAVSIGDLLHPSAPQAAPAE